MRRNGRHILHLQHSLLNPDAARATCPAPAYPRRNTQNSTVQKQRIHSHAQQLAIRSGGGNSNANRFSLIECADGSAEEASTSSQSDNHLSSIVNLRHHRHVSQSSCSPCHKAQHTRLSTNAVLPCLCEAQSINVSLYMGSYLLRAVLQCRWCSNRRCMHCALYSADAAAQQQSALLPVLRSWQAGPHSAMNTEGWPHEQTGWRTLWSIPQMPTFLFRNAQTPHSMRLNDSRSERCKSKANRRPTPMLTAMSYMLV